MNFRRQQAGQQGSCLEKWIVVTDLDGTLLDRSYDLALAAAALNQIISNWPWIQEIVLATSKTLSELQPFTRQLTRAPILIYENGAGYAQPLAVSNQHSLTEYTNHDQGLSYTAIRETLARLRRRGGFDFLGFGDISPTALSALTGLSTVQAWNAQQRRASEPLQWLGSEERLEAFRTALVDEGLTLVRGGQFHHVSSACDKWITLQAWREQNLPDAKVLACGDAPNDQQLLTRANQAVVFPDADGSYLLAAGAKVRHAAVHGPSGWLHEVTRVLADLSVQQTPQGTTL